MSANIYNGGIIGASALSVSGIWGVGDRGLTYGDLNYVATVLADSPLGFWLLNETSGSTAATQIGSDSLTYKDSPTFGAAGPGVAIPAGVTFNGTDENANSGNSSTFTTSASSAWTWEMWFKSTSASTTLAMGFVRGTNGVSPDTTCGLILSLSTAGTLSGFSIDSSNNSLSITGGSGLNDGNWHYAALTAVAAGVMTLYVDGTSVASTSTLRGTTSSQRSINVAANRSGASSWIQWFPGSIAAAAYYNTALSSTRITAHWNAGRT